MEKHLITKMALSNELKNVKITLEINHELIQEVEGYKPGLDGDSFNMIECDSIVKKLLKEIMKGVHLISSKHQPMEVRVNEKGDIVPLEEKK